MPPAIICRRKLMRLFLLIAALTILTPGLVSGQSAKPKELIEQGSVPSGALVELAKIARAYNIEIVATDPSFPVKCTYGTIDGKRAGPKELERYIDLFAPEFTIYPPSLIRLSLLKRIVLCVELSFAGQLRNAVPDFEHDALYIEVSRGSYSKAYLRKVLHHEFFHIVDYRDDGKLYQDERWSSLNLSSFKYGTGGKDAQERADSSLITDKFPGFLNYYSTTGVEEDKAEVFANLIVDPAYIEGRIKNDAVLNAKVMLMKALLTRFCPELNDVFWEKVKQMKRTSLWLLSTPATFQQSVSACLPSRSRFRNSGAFNVRHKAGELTVAAWSWSVHSAIPQQSFSLTQKGVAE